MKRWIVLAVLAAVAILAPLALAMSAPQVAWVKHPQNPVLRPGSPGSWDDRSVFQAKVVLKDGTYHMWYTGDSNLNRRQQIGYATSTDGVTWTRMSAQPVLTYDTTKWDAFGVGAPSVLWDPDANKWKMWYAGLPSFNDYEIGYAESNDGITWTKHPDSVLKPYCKDKDPCDMSLPNSESVVAPTVLKNKGQYHMWVAARGVHNQLFYATSYNGTAWAYFGGNVPVMSYGSDLAWDNNEVTGPSVLWNGSQFEMWYQGYHTGTQTRYIGHAVGANGNGWQWQKDTLNPVVGVEPGTWDANSLFYPSVLQSKDPNTLFMYYSGNAKEGEFQQIGLVAIVDTAVPTPRPTFPTEVPVTFPTPTLIPTPTGTPMVVQCATGDKQCVFMPDVQNRADN